MAEPKAAVEVQKGKKPQGDLEKVKIGQGLKEMPQAEVEGHASPPGAYSCWECGATNWCYRYWDYFICWNTDHALNWSRY